MAKKTPSPLELEPMPGTLEIQGQLYHVILLDDDEHSYGYVIEMLQKLFLISEDEAYRHAVEVDTSGHSIVITCELSAAEYARDQIHSYGPDKLTPNSRGSMKAIVEPASGEPLTM